MDPPEFCNLSFPPTEPSNYLESLCDGDEERKLTRLTADLDSIFLVGSNYNNAIDASCPNTSTWTFSNILKRTRSDKGSRVKLHFDSVLETPSFAGRKTANDFPGHWFPNIELCTISMDSGLQFHMNYYFLGSESVRSCNYLSTLELTVLTAAFNYAKDVFYNLPKTVAIIDEHRQASRYAQFVGDFHDFEGEVNYKGDRHTEWTTEKQTSVYGRLFLRSVFEALELFGSDIEKACNTRLMRDGVEIRIDVTNELFHGVRGSSPSITEFSETAKLMYHKGVIASKSVGLKKSFEKMPEGQVDIGNNVAVNTFVEKSMAQIRDEVGFYIDTNLADVEVDDDLDIDDSIPGLKFQPRKYAFFELPRDTDGVLRFYDVGINLFPGNGKYSFLPNGIHSIWLVNAIMSKRRFERIQRSTEPGRNNDLFVRLRHVENQELLNEIFDEIYSNQIDAGEDDDDIDIQRSSLLRPTVIHEMERTLLDMVQEQIELLETEVGDGQYHDTDEILKLLSRSKFTSYPIFGTNGMYSNVHTGKFAINVSVSPGVDGAPDGIKLSLPENASCIRGMQIYVPWTRKSSRKRIKRGHLRMLRFTTIVQQILFPSEFLNDTLQYASLLEEFQTMMRWFKEHHLHYHRQLVSLRQIYVRIEFFVEYRTPTPSNSKMKSENFDKMPPLSACLRMVLTKDLKEFMGNKLRETAIPLEKLSGTIATHIVNNTLPNFSTLPTHCLGAYLAIADLQVANLDFHPYKPRSVLKLIEGERRTKIGSWRIPLQYQKEITEEDKNRTGLLFGVETSFLKKRIQVSHLWSEEMYTKSNVDYQTLSLAERMKSVVRIPLHYIKACEQVSAVFQFFSRATESENPFNPNQGNDENVQIVGFVELEVDGKIDYEYLANELSRERRLQMFDALVSIVRHLYDKNYFDHLTNPRWKARGDYRPVKMLLAGFPQSRHQILKVVHEILISENATLDWGILSTMEIKDPENCFGKQGEDTSCTQWATDPSRRLHKLLHRQFGKIREKLVDQDSVDFGENNYENNLGLYSDKHLDYLLLMGFQKSRRGGVGDDAVVWMTANWRQRLHIGKAVKLLFEPTSMVAPLVHPVGNEMDLYETLPTDADSIRCLSYTCDTFWEIVNLTKGPCFSMVMLIKLTIHFILESTQRGSISWSTAGLKEYLSDMVLDGNLRISAFWDDGTKITSYIRQHLFNPRKSYGSLSEMVYLRERFAGDKLESRIRKEWSAALRYVTKDQVISGLECAKSGRQFPLVNYPLFGGYSVEEEQEIGLLLDTGNLVSALNRASVTGIITGRLMNALYTCRMTYQLNRLKFGKQKLGLAVDDDADYGQSNITLARAHGFPVGKAEMKVNRHK